MNSQVLGTAMIAAAAGIIVAIALSMRRERRRERDAFSADERRREGMWRERAQLFAWEEAGWEAIVARFDDAGLEILDGEDER